MAERCGSVTGQIACVDVDDDVGAIDEHQAAVVESDRPTTARVGDVSGADIYGVAECQMQVEGDPFGGPVAMRFGVGGS